MFVDLFADLHAGHIANLFVDLPARLAWHVQRDGCGPVDGVAQAHLLRCDRLQHQAGCYLGTQAKRPRGLPINRNQRRAARCAHRHNTLQSVAARGGWLDSGQWRRRRQSAQSACQQHGVHHRRCAGCGRHGCDRRAAPDLQTPVPRAQTGCKPQQPRQRGRPGLAAGRSHRDDFVWKSRVSEGRYLGHRRIMIDTNGLPHSESTR